MTKDEIPDPQKLQIRLYNNGTLMQNFNTSDMAHKIPRCIEWLSSVHALEPGDIVATGTNHRGLNPFMDGDKIELDIEGVGRLAFNVKDELKRNWERRDAAADARTGGAEDARQLPGHHAAIDRQIRHGALTRRIRSPQAGRVRPSTPSPGAGEGLGWSGRGRNPSTG